MTLDGSTTLVADLNRTRYLADGYDSDSRRTVFAVPRCDERSAIVAVARGAPAFVDGPPRCPLSLTAWAATDADGATVSIPARCPLGCSGYATLRARGRILADRSFAARPGRFAISLRLRANGRRLLRRHASVRATIQVAHFDRTGRRHLLRQPTTLGR